MWQGGRGVLWREGQGPTWVSAGEEGELPQQRGQRSLLGAGPDTLVPGKNVFFQGRWVGRPWTTGRFLVQKELLPTPSFLQPKEKVPRSTFQPGEVIAAGRGAGLPEAKQFPAQSKTPGTAVCQNSQHREVAFPAPNS